MSVIDFPAQNANASRTGAAVTPLLLAGWTLATAAGLFFAYVLWRSVQVGVFDAVVAAILGGSAAACFVGLGLVRVSGPVRAWLSRQAMEANSGEASGSPVPIEEYRRQRMQQESRARITCRACGADYDADASVSACPECGRSSIAV